MDHNHPGTEIHERPVKVSRLHLVCSLCKKDMLLVCLDNPNKTITYECPKCGFTKESSEQYPKTFYKDGKGKN